MQQTYQCPNCGSQNAIGERFCRACGKRLIPNCPYCGSQTTGQFFCPTCGARLFGATPPDQAPSLHILPLDQQTKHLFTFGPGLDGSPGIFIPAITTGGRLSILPAAENTRQFRDLEKDISRRVRQLGSGYQSYLCVGLSLAFSSPQRVLFIYEVVGSTDPIPELQRLHDLLAGLGGGVSGDEYWRQVESYFATEPQRSWMNHMITRLQGEINWTQLVDRAMAAYT